MSSDELGAHVSASGGVDRAPERAHAIESVVLQLFTKQPSRWAEPDIDADTRKSFRRERRSAGIRTAVAHDSYLINLSSPDDALWERSLACFIGELRRSTAIGLDFVPLLKERYDLVIPRRHYESDLLEPLLSALGADRFRSEVDALGGYDTTMMGSVVAESGGDGL